ncbi:MAG: glycoside hydrolase family 2 protein [Lachnospiraceae bacterium]|nr:glycoside hydrolase family 2 protein [Lachnospiraceae bacterium]
MKTQLLNGLWAMKNEAGDRTDGQIPGSVYSFYLDAGKMEDPYYRDNEFAALELVKQDYSFSRFFDADLSILGSENQHLRFDGVDTISEIFLNGVSIGSTDNMFCAYEFDVKGVLKETGNFLEVCIQSPTAYIAMMDAKDHIGGSEESMRGFSHLRKSHCMFGWDWGPRLPDEGIWKDVKLLGFNNDRISDVRIHQHHMLADGSEALGAKEHAAQAHAGQIRVELTVDVLHDGKESVRILLEAPDGTVVEPKNGAACEVPSPRLWWPNGLGEQTLYKLTVILAEGTEDEERQVRLIGLRTAAVQRKKDQWGETFAHEVNGRSFFAMGADYIPEDSIYSRMTRERTEKLMQTCRDSNYNTIRVWGGGIYPGDDFYDLCDRYGFLVWQDLMFACAYYRLTDAFAASIKEEIRQNVRRLRHHASLGLWCGNNEMESFTVDGGYECDDVTRADYLIQNEYIIPEILKEEDPDTFYWPSSPSSGGKLVFPSDPDRGDVHYWDVWHGGKPFTEYRKFYFRYLSEYGFQSFPGIETVRSFTEPEDRNIFSYVMEMHQRNAGANGKIMQYLSQTYLYPGSFETVLYASQLLQAEAIRYGVEHFRRNRRDERCMGAVYWQLNDIWPVASWASVDYYGRWKALQYYAARFFSPVMISCEEQGMVSSGRTCISDPSLPPVRKSARLNVTNETWEPVTGSVRWELRNADSELLRQGDAEVTVDPFSSLWLPEMDLADINERQVHLHYGFFTNNAEISSGSVLFIAPKHYCFADPKLTVKVLEDGRTLEITAHAYAKSVEVYSESGYIRTGDNYWDMEAGTRRIELLEGEARDLRVRSVFDIR